MNLVLVLAGLALLGLTLLDVLWTTISQKGEGPLTKHISKGLWHLALARRGKRVSGFLLEVIGTAILVAVFLTWVLLLWTGWFLLFSAEPGAVVEAQTGAPADFWSRVYFTGFTIFTLGVGDYTPEGNLWQVATALASINGLFLVTLSITYLIPVLSSVAVKRQMASSISGLGPSPADIVIHSWNGQDFRGLEHQLLSLASTLGLHAERQLAYPIVRYFHTQDRGAAVAPNFAALDEALSLLEYGLAPDWRPDPAVLRAMRSAMAQYLGKLHGSFLRQHDEVPSYPSLEPLRVAGLPVVDDATFFEALDRLRERRRLLLSLVLDDGWSWDDVYPAPAGSSQPIASESE